MSLLLALLALQSPAASPEPPRQRFSERVEVIEVAVHAVVTDRDGRPVLGLEPADFVVFEEGRRVEVTSAVYHSWGRPGVAPLRVPESTRAPADATPGREPGGRRAEGRRFRGRLFVFVFHDLLRGDRETLGVLGHQLRAGRGARKWLREGFAPGDLAAVAGYDMRLKIHQDFTGDLAALDRAIGRAVSREPEEQAAAAPGAPSLLDHLPPRRERRDRSTSLRDALGLLAEALRPVDGPKSLLLFSVGIGLDGSERGLFGRRDAPTLIERLNDSELAVYCLDTTPPEVEHALAGTLALLAESTGGEYFGHIARFQAPLRRIERRLQGYYLLIYLTDRLGGGYRRIDVATRGRELVVAARRGYIAR